MMKFFFLATITLVTTMSVGSTSQAADPANPIDYLKPIRQVTGRVKIMKFAFKKTSAGSYEYAMTPICQKDVMVDVYDVRNAKTGDTYKYGPVASCDAEIDGRKTQVEAVAVVALRKQSLFDQEPETELRANFFSLQSRDGSGAMIHHASGSVVTRDIMASAILDAQDSLDWKCAANGTCAPSNLETFGGMIEFGP